MQKAQVWAVTMVKDEEDVIATVLLHLLAEGVDHIVVADNLSTDGTRKILDDLACAHAITVLDDPEPAYLQSIKMTRLAHYAGARGAEWIIPFDADEIWYSPHGRLVDVLSEADTDIAEAAMFNHVPWPWHLHNRPIERLTRRYRRRSCTRKVAVRYGPQIVIGMGNHDASGWDRRLAGLIEVRHFSYRGFQHLRRKTRVGKQAVDAAGDALEPGQSRHWRSLGAASNAELLVAWVKITCHPGYRRNPAPIRSLDRSPAGEDGTR